MTKREIADIEKLLNDYSFQEMYEWINGRVEDSAENFSKAFGVRRVLLILGYKTRCDRKAKKEGIEYNLYKVEKWS